MGDRGMGRVFLPRYKDKSGVLRDAAVWWIAYYHNGKEVRESSKSKNRNMAVKLLKDRIAAQASGTLVSVEAQRIGFEEMAERLFRDYRLKARRSLDRADDAVTHLRYFFGMYRGLDITDSLVEAYVDHRVEEGAATSTVHYELALLKRMFRLCRKLLLVRPEFPVLRAQNIRQGFFEEQEFRSLHCRLHEDLQPVAEFSHLTGWRVKSEILPLQWKVNVDFTAGEVRLEPGTTKNDEGRVFPFRFLPELEALLRRQFERTEAVQKERGIIVPWVFHRNGRKIKDFRKSWKIALEAAGLPASKIPHDFRRTAVRNLERAGVPRSVAMRLVGHKTESIYRRYAIVAPRDLEDGLKRLADFRAVVTEESVAKGKVKRFRGRTRHLP